MNKTHIAIMKKSWGLTKKILSGEKKIESRWYLNRSAPWDKIKTGDTVYFKDSGEPIRIKAIVDKVLQFENLNPVKVKELLDKHGSDDGIAKGDIDSYFQKFKNKRCCLFIFLIDVQKIRPFEIDKSGFGSMAAWLIVEDLKKIKKEVI
jgi:ASC-1-like (ASCH) protein